MGIVSDRELALEKKLALENAQGSITSFCARVRGGKWWDTKAAGDPEEGFVEEAIEYLLLIDRIERHPTMTHLVRLK